MKVVLSAPGRYWAFDLAQQLLKRDCLEQLITGYPRFEVKKYGLSVGDVITLPLNQVIYRAWSRLPRLLRDIYDPLLMITELFDKQARRRVRGCDIFVGWAGLSLHTMRKAKSWGAITLVERGSSHILFQQEILREEYELTGLKGPRAHAGIIERELQEYEEADYIVVPSGFVKNTFLQHGINEDKLILNPFGVNQAGFRPVKKEDDVFRVVFAGGISLRKGIHYLLQAFSELKLPNSELLLIGSVDDNMKSFFKKYTGTFKWIGPRRQEDLCRYYSQSSIFVMPSIEEGLAMVQLQAMACGLPLICTTNTGGEDLVEEGRQGFVVPIRDVETLKEKILLLYEDSARREEMGRAAQERVAGGFSWDDYGRRTVENYRRILDLKNG